MAKETSSLLISGEFPTNVSPTIERWLNAEQLLGYAICNKKSDIPLSPRDIHTISSGINARLVLSTEWRHKSVNLQENISSAHEGG